MHTAIYRLVSRIYEYLWKHHPDISVPILQGKFFKKRWIIGSTQVECALGSYESGQRIMVEKVITKGNVVYDIGANVGYYTLLTALAAGGNGKVIAFEPLPRNIYYFKKHLQINKNFMLIIKEDRGNYADCHG